MVNLAIKIPLNPEPMESLLEKTLAPKTNGTSHLNEG